MTGNRGFTLLELMIVITIISITIGFVGPNLFGNLTTSRMDKATRDMMTIIQIARSAAITRHQAFYVRFDLDESVVGVYPKPASTGLASEMIKEIKLPEGVRITGIKSPYQTKKDQGSFDLTITCDGLVEQGVMYVEGGLSDTYTLVIKPFSGNFRIYDHYKEISYGG